MNNDTLFYESQDMEYAAQAADTVIKHGYAGLIFDGRIVRREPGDTSLSLVAKLFPDDWAKAPSADQWVRKGPMFFRIDKCGNMYKTVATSQPVGV